MTYTLAELTYELAIELGIVVEGTATGGSTTTIVDANDRDEDQNYWVEGSAWIVKDAGGAGAAPQWEYSVISGFTGNTVTLRDALTVAVAAGDVYALAKKRFGLPLLIQSVNRALRDLGTVPNVDTSLTTAGSKTEYDLPAGAMVDVRKVFIQTNTGDADYNLWRELFGWEVHETGVGSANKIVFSEQPIYPYALKIIYAAPHPKLHDYNDKLSEEVPWERITYRAAQHVHFYYRQRTRSNEDWLTDGIEYYRQLADAFDAKLPIHIPRKPGKLALIGSRARTYPGDRTPR